ncbi:MAG: C25 family peptidase propeptide domain-containing protein [Caldilineaceae bacterium]
MPAELTHTFNIPDYEITTDEAGFSHVVLDGFYSYGLPGDPDLPAAVTYLALPPSVPLESVTVEINPVQQVDLPDSYQIAPVGPYLRCDDDQDGEWGPHAASIVDGKNMEVYGRDAYFPAQPVERVAVSQMRQWRFVQLRFWPVAYNPASGRLRLITEATVTLHYELPAVGGSLFTEPHDTFMQDRAAQMFENFAEAQIWYDGGVTGGAAMQPGYAVSPPIKS